VVPDVPVEDGAALGAVVELDAPECEGAL